MAEKSFFEKLTKSVLEKQDTPSKPSIKRKVNFVAEEKSAPEDVLPEKTKEEEGETHSVEEPTQEEGQLTIDVYQTDNEIIIKSTIAGTRPEDLDIDITSDMITIRGKRVQDEKIKPENYFYQECYWGPFSRSVILPQDIIPDQADASMKNSILTIRLPKTESLRTKKLKVRSLIS